MTDDSWIGGTDSAVEGTWRWIATGSQFWSGGSGGTSGGAYANWKSGQPANTANQDCAVLEDGAGNGKWNDESCSGSREYVCEGIVDLCPTDEAKTRPGQCGCGNPDTDSDSDGTADCVDACDLDPNKTEAGQCGCGNPDTDGDNDGTADCVDACPADPEKAAPGACGCGVADTDADSDGAIDCEDECPGDSTRASRGDCGCSNDPEPAGAPCNDGMCAANTSCNGAGMCGAPTECGVPDSDCEFARWSDAPYWFCDNDRPYSEARARCRALGMDLVTIESEGEDSFVTEHADEHSFLGGSDQTTEGTWRWLATGRRFWTGDESGSASIGVYTNWESGEPSDSLSSHDCAVKSLASEGRWKSHSCSTSDAFVCEGVRPPPDSMQDCVDSVTPREDLTGAARERAYQEDLLRYCTSPGSSACLQGLRAQVNLDYASAAQALIGKSSSPAQYLALSRDRARKASAFENNPSRATALCAADSDGDFIPNGIDVCPSTPPLTPTNDSGCTDSTLPAAPSATDVETVLGGMGVAVNGACSGARLLPRSSPGAFYRPAHTELGTFIFAGRVESQPVGCPVRYVFDIEEIAFSPSPPGFEVTDRYTVAFMDSEEQTALLGFPLAVPPGVIQFNPKPSDAGTRGRLAVVGGTVHIRFRVNVINAAGMQAGWSDWKITDNSDCPPLGFYCE